MVDVVKTLRLEDGGTIKAATENAKLLNKELNTTKAAASKALSSAKDVSAANRAESRAYDTSRAAVGTGAAGRDFAKESQGLGGLVRVYATFAANLFAVSAAYRALSNAADTTNLVEGLNQLGAASGRNLGTLAKQIVSVTDNAVSMREAMVATAQTTSAGLSSVDVLRVAKGAKQASQALGIDMPDALSRLSRGITKLEPELLDELGIFVRVDKASQEYAKSIGKSALSLTDFEKRAAFANAVLGQVEKKFGDIKIPANPYTQLLAGLKNVAQSGLEVVNNVLGPLVGLLAKSPTGIAVAMAGVATVLLSQAIPALTSFRENLRATATEAATKAKETKEAFALYKEGNYQQLQAKLSSGLKAEGAAIAKSLEVAKTALSSQLISGFGAVKDIKKGPIEDTTKANLDRLRVSIQEQENKLKTTSNKLSDEENAKLTQKIQQLKLVESLTTKAVIDKAAFLAKEEAEMRANGKKPGATFQESLLTRVSDKAAKSELKSSMVANAADNASFLGATDAWRLLNLEIDKNKDKLGSFDKLATRVRGGMSIISSAAMTLVSAFGTWAIIIGAVVTALTMLVSWGKKNAEQIETSNASLATSVEAYKTLGRVIELTSKMDPFEKLSISSIKARATAIEELSVSIKKTFEDVQKEVESRNLLDIFTNSVSKIWGGDSESKLADTIATGLVKSIELAKKSPEMQTSLNKLLDVTNGKTSKSDILKLFTVDKNKQAESVKALTEASKETKRTSMEVLGLSDAFDTAAKANSEFVATLNSSDPVAQLGQKSAKAALEMSKALSNPLAASEELRKILTDPVKLSLFGESDRQSLIAVGVELESLQSSFNSTTQQAASLREEIAKLKETERKKDTLSSGRASLNLPPEFAAAAKISSDFDNKAKALTESLAAVDAESARIQARIQDNVSRARDSAVGAFIKGAEQIQASILQGYAKAAIIISKAYNQAAPDTTEGIKRDTQLANKELDLQLASIRVSVNLIKAQEELRIAIIEDRLSREKQNLRTNPMDIGASVAWAKIAREERDVAFSKSQINAKNPVSSLIEKINSIKKDDTLSKEDKNDSINRVSGSLAFSSALAQQGAKAAEVSAQKKANLVGQEYKLIDKRYSDEAQRTKLASEALQVDKASLEAKYAAKALSEEEYAKSIANIEAAKIAISSNEVLSAFDRTLEKLNADLKANPADARKINLQIGETMGKQSDASSAENAKAKAQSISSQAAIEKAAASEKQKAQELLDTTTFNSATANLNISIAQNAQEQAKLDKLNSQGVLNVDEYNQKNSTLGLTKLALEYEKEKLSINKDAKAEQDALIDRLNIQLKNGASSEMTQKTLAELDAVRAVLDARLKLAEVTNRTSKESLDLTNVMNEKTKAFSDYFQSAVGSMSDALVDFGLTGKQSFGEMVQSMITDLIKLELRMTLTNSYKSMRQEQGAGGGGLLSGLGGLVRNIFGFANGGSFDTGVQKFARGGTFTNSVVTSPTMFKFAKGTGLMGEAGPEAIMPLKRDSNGTLGVRSTSPSTTVFVNNYGNDKAEAKETVDSRGNRKIEVTIGEMVAGEISRPGSAAQSSIRSTFGSKPQLVRR